jgi:inner membrane protein
MLALWQDNPMTVPGFFTRLFRSPSFKFVLVGVLVLIVSALTGVVWLLSKERQSRAVSVETEISKNWGAAQRILGPYLIVPYTVKEKQGDSSQIRRAVFLPDTLNITGKVETEQRRRGIYNATVYQTKLTVAGQFRPVDLSPIESDKQVSIRWQDAMIALGIDDVSGLKNNVRLEAGGKTIDFEPGTIASTDYRTLNGIHANLKPLTGVRGFNAAAPLAYKIDLVLNGSSSLAFAPAGRQTAVSLESNWPHPSFTGFLPLQRSINQNGFSASWSVPFLARDVPQVWGGTSQGIVLERFSGKDLGVNLFVPVDYYSLVERALKYGLMFVAAAFGSVFVLELLTGRRVHPVQYIFVGLALVTFYVLLLSLSEHIGFATAYFFASTATGGMISTYVGMVLRSLKRGLTMLAIFSGLYGLLYMILQLEDYALLAGSVAAFVLLTATMFATLRVNWSGEESGAGSAA